MTIVDTTKFDAYLFNLLVHKIKNTKAQFDADLADTDQYLKGSRYNDDQRIARMVVGNIYAECKHDLAAAQAKFISLSSVDMMPYIKDAVLDSAGADHWYTYEKVW